jgi:aspartyl protease family protein
MDGVNTAQLVYLILLLAAVTGWVMVEYRGRLGTAMRTGVAWGLIFVGVMAGYGLWQDLRLQTPRQAVMISDAAMEIPRAPDGHYYLTLTIGGKEMEFMVDTGATNVVLSREAARSLGVDPDALSYVGQAQTANGVVQTARLNVGPVTLGPWIDPMLGVWVNGGQMEGSLLGMDYLGKYRIEIADNRMVLRR